MAILRYQYCHLHKTTEEYPACDIGIPESIRNSRNAQLPPGERPILWTKPGEGGKIEIRYPGRNDGQMPEYYKSQGYEKTEFTSYHEHQKFCKDHEIINHAVEGIK